MNYKFIKLLFLSLYSLILLHFEPALVFPYYSYIYIYIYIYIYMYICIYSYVYIFSLSKLSLSLSSLSSSLSCSLSIYPCLYSYHLSFILYPVFCFAVLHVYSTEDTRSGNLFFSLSLSLSCSISICLHSHPFLS